MKRLHLSLLLLVLLGCGDEGNVDLANEGTFVRYFNGDYDDIAVLAQPTADGNIVILASTEIESKENVGEFYYRMKLIKVDPYGNILVDWPKSYPDPSGSPDPSNNFTGESYLSRSLAELPSGGFALVGDSVINLPNGGRIGKLTIVLTDNIGQQTQTRTYRATDFFTQPVANGVISINGFGITQATNGNLIVLARVTSTSPNDMLVAEVNASDLSIVWSQAYGSTESTLVNRIFANSDNSLVWAGTAVTSQNPQKSDVRIIRAFTNSQGAEDARNYGEPGFNEEAHDIGRFGDGYVLVGSTDNTTGGDKDIQFARLNSTGETLNSQSYGNPNLNETAASVCVSRDGALLILSTAESGDANGVQVGRGEEDLLLQKVTPFGGAEIWTKYFGSVQQDVAASVRQLSDGSILILGTTEFAGLKTLMLIKTNENGNY
jgi:hypothetical protein